MRDLAQGRGRRRPWVGRAPECLHGADDAGEALGDSIYEARLYVAGEVAALGADCVEKGMRSEHVDEVRDLLVQAGIDDVDPGSFRRYGSARRLYNFHVDNAY